MQRPDLWVFRAEKSPVKKRKTDDDDEFKPDVKVSWVDLERVFKLLLQLKMANTRWLPR